MEMGSLQAPHQKHNPRYQGQEMRPQTYQIYADAARSGSSRRPTETPPPAGLDPRGRTYEGEGRRRPPPTSRSPHHRGRGKETANPPHPTPGPKNENQAPAAERREGRNPLAKSQGGRGGEQLHTERMATGHRPPGKGGGQTYRGKKEGRKGGERGRREEPFLLSVDRFQHKVKR